MNEKLFLTLKAPSFSEVLLSSLVLKSPCPSNSPKTIQMKSSPEYVIATSRDCEATT